VRAIVVVLAFWCAVHNGVLAGTLSEADSALKALKIKLVHGTIARIDIFFMPYDMLTVARVTPEVLEMDAQKKMSVELSSDLAETLVRAIDNTKIYQTRYEPDLRWGAVFFEGLQGIEWVVLGDHSGGSACG